MARASDSGQLHLAEVFLRLQAQLLADLSVGRLFEHPSSAGSATEQLWLDLITLFLPKRFRAAPAFVINAAGRRSRQIDLAIFDNLRSTALFPHPSGPHVPVESVYAVFEIKPTFSRQWLTDAAHKTASVRALCSSKRRILGGLLATSSVWQRGSFQENLARSLGSLRGPHQLDFGCALEHGAFERHGRLHLSPSNHALIFFMLRLIARLNSLAPARAPDLLRYLKHSHPV